MEWTQVNQHIKNWSEIYHPLKTYKVKLIIGFNKNLHIMDPMTLEKIKIVNAGGYKFLQKLVDYLEKHGEHSQRRYSSPLRGGSYLDDIYQADMYMDEIIVLIDIPNKKSKHFRAIMEFLGADFK